MAVTGLSIETKDFKFDVFKKDNGRFEIQSGGVYLEFPPDAVEFRKATDFSGREDPHDSYGVVMSVKWGCGHKIHFQAYMPLRSAQDLNKNFPELKFSE